MAPLEQRFSEPKDALPATKRRMHSEVGAAPRQLLKHSSFAEADHFLCKYRTDVARPITPVGPNAEKVREELLRMMQPGQGGENRSVLLLGEDGSGKKTIVEWCLRKLKETSKRAPIILRCHGGAHRGDLECLRALGAQLRPQMATGLRPNASFREGVDWLTGLFRGGLMHASALVLVLEQFEEFCARARQTLLYSLFDAVQEARVDVCIVGTSSRLNVADMLEKRIRSRFSMQQLLVTLPQNMDELIEVLFENLRLPTDSALAKPFVKEYHDQVRRSLDDRSSEWMADLRIGRPPSWFLAKCWPLHSLLVPTAEASEPPSKRRRLLARHSSGSSSGRETADCFLEGLAEDALIVLIAMYHLRRRNARLTLATVLYEIEQFHRKHTYTARYDKDMYSISFDKLRQARLVEFTLAHAAPDLRSYHTPCRSVIDRMVGEHVMDLDEREDSVRWPGSPLRKLPSVVQNWAVHGAKTD